MPFDAVKVEGLADLQRSLREVSKGIQANLTTELLVAAQPARAVAERLAVDRISRMRQSGWNEMRLGTSGSIVYMAPKRRGRGNASRRRPNLGRLLVSRAMEPSLALTGQRIEAGAQKAVDRAIRQAGF